MKINRNDDNIIDILLGREEELKKELDLATKEQLIKLKLFVQEAITRKGGEIVNPFDCIKL